MKDVLFHVGFVIALVAVAFFGWYIDCTFIHVCRI